MEHQNTGNTDRTSSCGSEGNKGNECNKRELIKNVLSGDILTGGVPVENVMTGVEDIQDESNLAERIGLLMGLTYEKNILAKTNQSFEAHEQYIKALDFQTNMIVINPPETVDMPKGSEKYRHPSLTSLNNYFEHIIYNHGLVKGSDGSFLPHMHCQVDVNKGGVDNADGKNDDTLQNEDDDSYAGHEALVFIQIHDASGKGLAPNRAVAVEGPAFMDGPVSRDEETDGVKNMYIRHHREGISNITRILGDGIVILKSMQQRLSSRVHGKFLNLTGFLVYPEKPLSDEEREKYVAFHRQQYDELCMLFQPAATDIQHKNGMGAPKESVPGYFHDNIIKLMTGLDLYRLLIKTLLLAQRKSYDNGRIPSRSFMALCDSKKGQNKYVLGVLEKEVLCSTVDDDSDSSDSSDSGYREYGARSRGIPRPSDECEGIIFKGAKTKFISCHIFDCHSSWDKDTRKLVSQFNIRTRLYRQNPERQPDFMDRSNRNKESIKNSVKGWFVIYGTPVLVVERIESVKSRIDHQAVSWKKSQYDLSKMNLYASTIEMLSKTTAFNHRSKEGRFRTPKRLLYSIKNAFVISGYRSAHSEDFYPMNIRRSLSFSPVDGKGVDADVNDVNSCRHMKIGLVYEENNMPYIEYVTRHLESLIKSSKYPFMGKPVKNGNQGNRVNQDKKPLPGEVPLKRLMENSGGGSGKSFEGIFEREPTIDIERADLDDCLDYSFEFIKIPLVFNEPGEKQIGVQCFYEDLDKGLDKGFGKGFGRIVDKDTDETSDRPPDEGSVKKPRADYILDEMKKSQAHVFICLTHIPIKNNEDNIEDEDSRYAHDDAMMPEDSANGGCHGVAKNGQGDFVDPDNGGSGQSLLVYDYYGEIKKEIMARRLGVMSKELGQPWIPVTQGLFFSGSLWVAKALLDGKYENDDKNRQKADNGLGGNSTINRNSHGSGSDNSDGDEKDFLASFQAASQKAIYEVLTKYILSSDSYEIPFKVGGMPFQGEGFILDECNRNSLGDRSGKFAILSISSSDSYDMSKPPLIAAIVAQGIINGVESSGSHKNRRVPGEEPCHEKLLIRTESRAVREFRTKRDLPARITELLGKSIADFSGQMQLMDGAVSGDKIVKIAQDMNYQDVMVVDLESLDYIKMTRTQVYALGDDRSLWRHKALVARCKGIADPLKIMTMPDYGFSGVSKEGGKTVQFSRNPLYHHFNGQKACDIWHLLTDGGSGYEEHYFFNTVGFNRSNPHNQTPLLKLSFNGDVSRLSFLFWIIMNSFTHDILRQGMSSKMTLLEKMASIPMKN